MPKITKIVLNMGIGEATQDAKLVQVAAADGRTWSGSSSTRPGVAAELTLQ